MKERQGTLFAEDLPRQSLAGEPILEFQGAFRWLSNFYRSPLDYEGLRYPTVEHAYQAAKSLYSWERERIALLATPGRAKRAGKRLTLRPDWEEVKVDVMRALLVIKFSQLTFRAKLIATGDRQLVEGNTWKDRFWGQCPIGNGRNMLGKLLMERRAELRQTLTPRVRAEPRAGGRTPAPF